MILKAGRYIMNQTDIVIIGAGPVGLFAIFEAGMLGLRCHVVDTLAHVGGQCTALYPEKPIYDIPGFPSIAAGDLIERLEQQAAPFAPVYHLDQQVVGLARDGDDWQITTSRGTMIRARAVVLAAGAGAFGPNRPPLANLADYEGKSVFYSIRRRADLAGKRVVIAGGGDSAVDWALALAETAARVSVVHRRDQFRATPDSEAKLKKLATDGQIDLVIPYQLSRLEGQDGQLSAVIVQDFDGGERRIDADILLPFYGLAMKLGPILDWGLGIERNHVAATPPSMTTSQPGIFAIGDVATYPGKLKLILTGFAEAASAAHAIYPLVYPDKALHFEYSTTKGVQSA